MAAEALSGHLPANEPYRIPTHAIATMGLLYGFASMLCLPYSFLPMIDNPWAVGTWHLPPDVAWVLFATLTELGLGFLLFVGSMGAFSYAKWSRKLLLTWAGITLAWGFVGLAFYIQWFFPDWRGNIAIVRGEGPWGGIVFWAIDWFFGLAVLHHLTRPWVRERFESGEPASEL